MRAGALVYPSCGRCPRSLRIVAGRWVLEMSPHEYCAGVPACLRARGCVPYGCATAASYKSDLALMDEIKAAAAKVVSTRLDFKCAVTLPRPPMRALLCLPSQPPCPADAGSPAARALARARSALLCGQCETRAPCRLGYEA